MTECVDEVLAERTRLTLRGKGTNFGADWSVRLQRPNWPLRFRPTDHNRPRISIMSIWFFEIATSEIAQPTLIDVESRVVAWSFPIVVLRRVRFEKKLVISSSLSFERFILILYQGQEQTFNLVFWNAPISKVVSPHCSVICTWKGPCVFYIGWIRRWWNPAWKN